MQRSNDRTRCRHVVAAFGLLIFALLQSHPTGAQAPTPEQIEIFRNLPPDQQQAVLEALGRSGITSGMPGMPGIPGVPSTTLPPQTGVEPVAVPESVPREADTRERTPSGELRLAPDDTLLVEILPLQWQGQERVLTVPDVESETGARTAPRASAPDATRPADATPIVRDEDETARLDRLVDTVRRGNPYRVSRGGTLDLPGLAPIPVAGLTAVQATHRLTVERLLQDFRIRLTPLPLEPPLRPFGHDIFENAQQYFPPVTGLPVPVDYVVGPGDLFEVQLFGTT